MDGHRKRRDHGHKSRVAEPGANAVLSGLFLDPPTTSRFANIQRRQPSSSKIPRPRATGLELYGSQGYNVVGNTSSYPAYAAIQPFGASTGTWTTSTTATLALQDASGTGRTLADWYSAMLSSSM